MPWACRLGDTATHPGAIATSASRTRIVGALAARMGDMYDCIEHGMNPIIGGSASVWIEGARAARTGDPTECGALLISGQYTVNIGD